jgi:hypothetical protein
MPDIEQNTIKYLTWNGCKFVAIPVLLYKDQMKRWQQKNT